jgi:alpha-mannosidase
MLDNRYKQIGFKAISIPQVAMMANSNLQRTIKIVKPSKPNEITALVTFEKRDKVKGKLTFEFEDNQVREKKIKSLHIEFL